MTTVTKAQLEIAWADVIAAADWHEKVYTDESRDRMGSTLHNEPNSYRLSMIGNMRNG